MDMYLFKRTDSPNSIRKMFLPCLDLLFALPVFLKAFPKPQPSQVLLCSHLKLASLIRKAARGPRASPPGHKSRGPFEYADHAAADL